MMIVFKKYSKFLASILVLATFSFLCGGQGTRDSRLATNLPFLDVNAFAQDSLGYMWIATLGGLNRFNGYEYELFTHDATDSTSIQNDFVFSLLIDSKGELLAGTAEGVSIYSFETARFENVFAPAHNPVYSIFEDHEGSIWLATPDGPGILNRKERKIDFPAGTFPVNALWEDDFQRLWVGKGSGDGLAVRKGDGSWETIALPGNRMVTCRYEDPQGIWWLGTNEGVLLFDPSKYSFNTAENYFPDDSGLKHVQITFITEIEPLKLLIGTAIDGLFHYDILSKKISHNEPSRFNPNRSAQLHACYVDNQRNVWIGTYDKGFVLANKLSDHFNQDNCLSDAFNEKFVTRVREDSRNNLWIATRYEGLYRYTSDRVLSKTDASSLLPSGREYLEALFVDSKDRLWIAFESQLIVAQASPEGSLSVKRRYDLANVRVIKEDKDGVIWIGTWTGLFRIAPDDIGSDAKEVFSSGVTDLCMEKNGDMLFSCYGIGIFRFKAQSSAIETVPFPDGMLGALTCITMTPDSKGRVWIGSYGNGLVCMEGDKFLIMSKKDGLPSNNVLCFAEDLKGGIWASTSSGIVRIKDTDAKLTCTTYYRDQDQYVDQYHEKSGCRTKDGRIFFGGNHGLSFFSPSDFSAARKVPVACIEDLKIFNQSVIPAHKGSALKKSVQCTEKIVLNHKQTTISLDYSAIDFFTSNNLTYKYMLEGFEKQWNHVGTHRRATYSNLPRGRYVFKVCATNEEGIDSEPTCLNVAVKAAPWFSLPAWLLYAFLLTAIFYLMLSNYMNAKLSRKTAEIERNEKEREKEISRMKITFFTNISHELRTPLTLISAPIQKLLGGSSLEEKDKELLNVINRNNRRLLQLVNQIMDFAKMENGFLNLKVENTDIAASIKESYDSFSYLADRKHIALSFFPHESEMKLWADADKIEKILNNLISNAIKHTPEGGSVKIATTLINTEEARVKYGDIGLNASEDYLEVSVDDTGTGVPADKMQELFVRYRQIESAGGVKPDYSGNGIGLHYTKFLVEKHKGRITAERKPEGGMVFSFILPLDDVYSDAEKVNSGSIGQPSGAIPEYEGTARTGKKPKEGADTVLIVEDNAELKDFIVSIMSEKYHVASAADGETAWNIICKDTPDLVISDVIMPGLSGYELCQKVKQSPEYSHIPVIILTAKSTVDEQIEGLEHGADAYICKPFNIGYLMLTVKNVFSNRDAMRRYFTTPRQESAEADNLPISEHDRKFMNRFSELLEKELSNPDLNIDSVTKELGFSRTALYRKIKGLTGLSPNDFIRNYRFKCAAEMIIKGEISLSEIAESTGFNSYSYFSKAFKQHFGIPPKDYIWNKTSKN